MSPHVQSVTVDVREHCEAPSYLGAIHAMLLGGTPAEATELVRRAQEAELRDMGLTERNWPLGNGRHFERGGFVYHPLRYGRIVWHPFND